MATTVKDLIEQLSTIDPTTPIVFQYLLPEHTEFSTNDFSNRVEALDSTDFADDMSFQMNNWLDDMSDLIHMPS